MRFALPEVAADFFAVLLRVRPQVQQVVGDLERRSEMSPERLHRRQVLRSDTSRNRTDLQWRNERVPTGFQLDHRQIVGVVELPGVRSNPLEFQRLTVLHGLAGHVRDSAQNAQRRAEPDAFDIVQEGLQRHRQHRVTHVDGDRDAVVHVQSGAAPTPPRLVLYVIVNEKGVVVQLQRRRGRQDRLEVTAEPEARRDAQGRPQRLPAATRIVRVEFVEAVRYRRVDGEESVDLAVACVFALREITLEQVQRRCASGHFNR